MSAGSAIGCEPTNSFTAPGTIAASVTMASGGNVVARSGSAFRSGAVTTSGVGTAPRPSSSATNASSSGSSSAQPKSTIVAHCRGVVAEFALPRGIGRNANRRTARRSSRAVAMRRACSSVGMRSTSFAIRLAEGDRGLVGRRCSSGSRASRRRRSWGCFAANAASPRRRTARQRRPLAVVPSPRALPSPRSP